MLGIKRLISAVAISLGAFLSIASPVAQANPVAAVAGGASCNGELFNPITDVDYGYLFPISVIGVEAGTGVNPPLMKLNPVCFCPGRLGIPVPGLGVTFWQPNYVVEIGKGGCLHTLKGIKALPGSEILTGEYTDGEVSSGSKTSRGQIHFYDYPLFKLLDLFTSAACLSPRGFNMAYISEPDYTWQDDIWSSILSPDSILYSTPPMQFAGAIDSISSNFGFPNDAIYWAAGSWGNTFPLTGNANQQSTYFQGNNLVMAKYITRAHRLGLMWQTIGPTAQCFSHPNPMILKSQYRINQIGPIPRYGKPVVFGDAGLMQFPPITNLPTKEHTSNLIWTGTQCCIRP